jgi:hypothetical protein
MELDSQLILSVRIVIVTLEPEYNINLEVMLAALVVYCYLFFQFAFAYPASWMIKKMLFISVRNVTNKLVFRKRKHVIEITY